MVKKTIFLLVLYFLQFYLTSLQGKEYFANSQEPEPVFGPLEPEPLEKIPGAGAGAAWKKNSGAGDGAA